MEDILAFASSAVAGGGVVTVGARKVPLFTLPVPETQQIKASLQSLASSPDVLL